MALESRRENNVVMRLAGEVTLPKMAKARQKFDTAYIPVQDIPGVVAAQLGREAIKSKIKPGMSVAITCGSRGLANMVAITRAMVDFVKACGAQPFVFPAMGSHGGATVQGQLEVLESFGVTEEAMGCPIRATMETVQVGHTEEGLPVFVDKFAHEADAILLCNRVKAHTAYSGPYESGVLKMLVIGVGKQHGAESIHEPGFANIARILPQAAKVIVAGAKVVAGLALVENAFDETCEIKAMTPQEMFEEEPKMLARAKSLMGRIIPQNLDVLVVEKMGKNISGDGMDPNVTGHSSHPELMNNAVKIQRLAVLDLTDETHGNGNGLGLADVTTKRLVDKLDVDTTYPNVVTSTVLAVPKVPLFTHSDKSCIQIALRCCNGIDKQNPRIVRIRDTMQLNEIYVSEALMEEVKNHPDMELLGEAEDWPFDEKGDLF